MLDFLQIILSGIAVGSSYALMALALVIVYKTSEVVNFAQGEMALISAYFSFMLLDFYGFSLISTLFFAFIFAMLLGAILEFAVLRRAKEPNLLGLIIITIGMEFVLLGFVSWKFGADQQIFPIPDRFSPFSSLNDLMMTTFDYPLSFTPYHSINLGGVYFNTLELLTLMMALVTMSILFLFYRYSRLGMAMKATQQNLTAARIMGIRTHRMMMMTWGISSLVGCLTGLLISPIIMEPRMMWDPMMKGFAAAVLGGMTSLPGSVAGAYILGIIENLFGGYVSIEFKSVVAFAIIVLVLCFKPSGLFARHYIKKV